MKTPALLAAPALAVALTFALHPLAMADTGHREEMAARFRAADKDNDGTLDRTEAEAMPRVAKDFDAIDADKSGTVSPDELRKYMKAVAKRMHDRGVARFKAADKDDDGTLDRTEAEAMPRVAKDFDAIDADKSGTVSLEEIHDYMRAARQAMHEKGSGHDMHGEGAGPGMHERGAAHFKAADKDNDGTLDRTEAEAMPHVAQHFDTIDADKSGTVSLEEIHDFMKAKRARRAK
jgi:Ca2+-binding EF-hand superfamily protein